VDDVEQAHDVDVVHLLEERYLADGGARDALVLGLEADLLEGDGLVVNEVGGAVYDAIGAYAVSAASRGDDLPSPTFSRRL
jgi:hypothetical protein